VSDDHPRISLRRSTRLRRLTLCRRDSWQ
jgi:hypothetical protein